MLETRKLLFSVLDREITKSLIFWSRAIEGSVKLMRFGQEDFAGWCVPDQPTAKRLLPFFA
jgi:hypothetical protein